MPSLFLICARRPSKLLEDPFSHMLGADISFSVIELKKVYGGGCPSC